MFILTQKSGKNLVISAIICILVLILAGCPGKQSSKVNEGDKKIPDPASDSGTKNPDYARKLHPPVTGYMPTPEQPLAPPSPPAAGSEKVPTDIVALAASVKDVNGNLVPLESGTQIKAGKSLEFQITLVNNTATTQEILFNTSQKIDIIVMDSSNKEIYKWSRGKEFPAVMSQIILEAGQKWSHSVTVEIGTGKNQLPPGTYKINVVLTGSPTFTVASENVTVTAV